MSDSTRAQSQADNAQTTVVDVAAEMHRIRDRIRQQQSSFSASGMTEIQRKLYQAQGKWHVREAPFVSKVPIIGPLIAAFRSAWNSVSAKWYVLRMLNQQNEYNFAVYQVLEELCGESETQLQAQAKLTSQLLERLAELELRLISMRRAAASTAPSLPQSDRGPAVEPAGFVTAPQDDWSYLAFNAAFTALGSVVRETYRQYVPLFSGRKNVLDAACGQGHFLELLKEAGIEAYGVDREAEMAEMCRLKDLRVEVADVLTHLSDLPGNSLGGVFCGHLIEHFDAIALQKLLSLAYDRLSPGGIIVCETPNTRNLFVMANTFYRDPTHRQPLHPETFQFMFRTHGFVNVELRYSLPVPMGLALEPLVLSPDSDAQLQALAAEINERLQRVNRQLFDYQNVAIIGYKPLQAT